ncbi:adenylylsulfatase HINT3 [Nymphaea colorata]|nr:adenylylsulfatase HINT3 [Nymphaea colorata]
MAAQRLSILLSHLTQTNPICSFSDQPPVSLEFRHLSGDSKLGSRELKDELPPTLYGDDGNSECRTSRKDDVENSCVFCRIVRGESPAFKLYEDDVSLCILDTSPLCSGHSLIIPKAHFPSLEATPPSVVAAMCSLVPALSSALMKATHCDSFNLVANSGAAAGQVIFHTHLHVIPRKPRDHLWTSESFMRRRLSLNKGTALLANDIRTALSQSQNTCSEESKPSSPTK